MMETLLSIPPRRGRYDPTYHAKEAAQLLIKTPSQLRHVSARQGAA